MIDLMKDLTEKQNTEGGGAGKVEFKRAAFDDDDIDYDNLDL